jgi:hypothetical protein
VSGPGVMVPAGTEIGGLVMIVPLVTVPQSVATGAQLATGAHVA